MACVTAPHDHDRVAASSKPLLRSACRIVPGRDLAVELRVERGRRDRDRVVELRRGPAGDAVSGTTAFFVQTLMHSPQSMQRSSIIDGVPAPDPDGLRSGTPACRPCSHGRRWRRSGSSGSARRPSRQLTCTVMTRCVPRFTSDVMTNSSVFRLMFGSPMPAPNPISRISGVAVE